ncbi:glycosyltransferase [Solimonas variicoloris]|uniref:glycosyltransferase n=1 Tax=Solimonas variicoloris TaxID=254408 RepID=UPI000361B050|nr:glycosyltransferase [Solimonas variicoloris]
MAIGNCDQPLHVLVVSALFDRKAEGICTGRLVRGMLDAGAFVTLVTSDRAELGYTHPRLEVQVFPVQPRDPKWLFRAWARLTDGLDCNLYLWSRRVAAARLRRPVDLVYARAWPDSSLMAGYRLAVRHGLPLWLHFSDPFPPPADPPLDRQRQADFQRLADRAQACTFTNAKTRDYQSKRLRFPHPDWGVIVPHVAPDPIFLAPRPFAHRFAYIGSFNSKRDPALLLRAFQRYLTRHPQARFTFAGPPSRRLDAAVTELGLTEHVERVGYCQDVLALMAAADVLLAMDNLNEEPVYSLTKTVESLVVNRPYLLIAKPESPDCELLARCGATARAVPPDSDVLLAEAMESAMAVDDAPERYEERFAVMREYGARHLAGELLKRMRDTVAFGAAKGASA